MKEELWLGMRCGDVSKLRECVLVALPDWAWGRELSGVVCALTFWAVSWLQVRAVGHSPASCSLWQVRETGRA